MLLIDKIAYTSHLSTVSVREKLIFILLPLLMALFAASNLLNLAIIVGLCPITLYFSRVSLVTYVRLLMLPAAFLLLSVITICIVPTANAHGYQLFSLQVFGSAYALSTGSLLSGLQLLSKSLAAISCLYFFALNTPLNSLLAYLQSLGVSSLLLTLMEFIYRFIFILYEQSGVMYTAQVSRLGYGGLIVSCKSYYQLFSCVFLRSLDKVDRINNALLSRGFDSNFQQFAVQQEHSPKLRKLTWSCALLLIGGWFLGGYI